MKNMRRIASLLLALVMVFGLATTAFAADEDKNDSITVNNAVVGETYKLYKMFDLVVNDEYDPTVFSYTVNEDWVDFFKAAAGETPAGAGNQYITVNELGYVTGVSDAAALAEKAAVFAKDLNALQSVKATETTVVFDGLANGYYLITSTLGTKAMIETTPDSSDVAVEEKNPEDTITKEVKEDSTGNYGESNDAQVGDTVEFKSTATVYAHTRNVFIHDTMDSGLTYQNDVKIEGLTADIDYIVLTPHEGDTFTIQITDAYIASIEGESVTLTLTYTAVLNENAVKKDDNGVAIVDQYNKTSITYGDSQSVEDETITITHKFSVFKHATNSTDNLAGAVFSLKKDGTVVNLIKLDDNNYRVAKTGEANAVTTFTTVASGDIVIWGVDADSDYTLLETEAPAGYNKLNAEVSVTVDDANGTRIDVENKSGSQLPATGGMGTTLFYVFGGIMVLAAAVLLVTKKRMNIAE